MRRPIACLGLAVACVLMAAATSAATITTYVTATTTLTAGAAGGTISPFLGTLDFGGDLLTVMASGTAYYGTPSSYGGPTNATSPDGLTTLYNGLPMGSLIGIFSTTANTITAIGTAFEIGSSTSFLAPSSGPAYLFLGYNDSYYWDNSGGFSVTVTYGSVPAAAQVPLPAGRFLLATALGLGLCVRRKTCRTG